MPKAQQKTQQKTIAKTFDHEVYETRLRRLAQAREVLDGRRVGSKSEAALRWNDGWIELLRDSAFHVLSELLIAGQARDLLGAIESGSYRDVQDAQRTLFDLIEREDCNGY